MASGYVHIDENFKWSFDMDDFHEHLDDGSDLEAIIRGQLYLEHVLLELLREALPRFERLNVSRMPFSTKVDLCDALGVLHSELPPPFKKINALRNEVAHNLNFEMTATDKAALFDTFPEVGKNLILDRLEGGEELQMDDVSVHRIVKTAIILADYARNHHVVWKRRKEEALENAKRALSDALHGGDSNGI